MREIIAGAHVYGTLVSGFEVQASKDHGSVQIATGFISSSGFNISEPLYTEQERAERVNWLMGMHEGATSRCDKTTAEDQVRREEAVHAARGAMFTHLDSRKACNDAITALRRARDLAFGKDA